MTREDALDQAVREGSGLERPRRRVRRRPGAGGRLSLGVLSAVFLGLAPIRCASQDLPASGAPDGLGVPGIRVGHATLAGGLTGCTVVLAEDGMTAGGDVRGGAPGTVETDLLDPVNSVDFVNAVILSGGSAFGLASRDGVMRYLEEGGHGFRLGSGGVVPIVTGAIIFDLGVNPDGPRPGSECGYQAAESASGGEVETGSVGAGAGATVGKLRGLARAMKGGVGTATIRLPGSGLVVSALVVVNAVGDVVDPSTGAVVAGVRNEGGGFADARRLLRTDPPGDQGGQNTTIGVVVTNARLSKAEANKVAQMAQDGLARAIVPSHTPADGDTMFSLASGDLQEGFTVSQVGALAAEAVSDAILSAVRSATGVAGVPAVDELSGR